MRLFDTKSVYVLIQFLGIVLWLIIGRGGGIICLLYLIVGGIGYRYENKKIKAQKQNQKRDSKGIAL